jgi:multiple sugar transport system ATP-binding protein
MNFAPVHIAAENGSLWAESEDFRIRLPSPITTRLGVYAGREAILGVRPEDLRIANGADTKDLSFDVAVEVVERLGSEILLDVAAGSTMMVASVEPNVTTKVHERVRLAINPDRMHFFDSQTEVAI